jgi:hypothetical protein
MASIKAEGMRIRRSISSRRRACISFFFLNGKEKRGRQLADDTNKMERDFTMKSRTDERYRVCVRDAGFIFHSFVYTMFPLDRSMPLTAMCYLTLACIFVKPVVALCPVISGIYAWH